MLLSPLLPRKERRERKLYNRGKERERETLGHAFGFLGEGERERRRGTIRTGGCSEQKTWVVKDKQHQEKGRKPQVRTSASKDEERGELVCMKYEQYLGQSLVGCLWLCSWCRPRGIYLIFFYSRMYIQSEKERKEVGLECGSTDPLCY